MGLVYKDKARYFCQITGQEIGKASTGTPQVVIRFRVLEEYTSPTARVECAEQYECRAYLYLSDGAAERTVQDLKRLGFTGTSFRQLDLRQANAVDMAGLCADFYCKHEEFNGVMREKWSVALEPKEIEPLSDSDLRSLDTLFGKALRSGSPAAAPARRAPAPAQEPAARAEDIGITDDDVPF